MIPQHKPVVTNEGSIGGTSVAASVDAEDMAHIMTVLTDLYSDNVLAVIREYSTNARDTHIKGKVDRPIEVTLPSRLSNTLTIRDFGEGMDEAQMVSTYTKYGKSNKRDDAEANGFLGIGSKSALTYTSTFTVASVKGGTKTQAVIFRDEEGLLHINVVSVLPTSEESGTTVTIPTKLSDNFEAKAAEFYKVWDKGTVLVNGDEPKHISDDDSFEQFGQHFIRRVSGYDGSKLHVVMGNVTYTQKMETPRQFRVPIESYTFVPNGSVKFVPSREALDLKPATKQVVADQWEDVGEKYLAHFTKGMAAAKTLRDAVNIYLPMQQVLGHQNNVMWNGVRLVDSIQFYGREWTMGYRTAGIGTTQERNTISLSNAYRKEAAFIVNRKSKSSLNAADKARLVEYMNAKGLDFRSVYFNGDMTQPMLADVLTLDWVKVMDATKTIVIKAARPKDEWEYYTVVNDRRVRAFGALPSGFKVVYASSTELSRNTYNPIDLDLFVHLPDADKVLFAYVNVNRQEKFVRDNPGAVHLTKYLDGVVSNARVSLTPEEVMAYNAYANNKADLVASLHGRTDDPTIDTIYATMDQARTKVSKIDRVCRMSRRGQFSVGGSDYMSKNYPLATNRHIEHSILYINHIKNGI